MTTGRPGPLNLLPWRESFHRRRRQQLLRTLALIVLVSVVVVVGRVHALWQQLQAAAPALAATLAQQASLADSLQRARLHHEHTLGQQQDLQQTLQRLARHAQWQRVLTYPEQSPGGLQITAMMLSAGQVNLSGLSREASLVSEFLNQHPNVTLVHLQLRADGWYEFGLVDGRVEVTP